MQLNVNSSRFAAAAVVALTILLSSSHAFVPSDNRSNILSAYQSTLKSTQLCMSSIGPGGGPGRREDDNALNDWMSRKDEPEFLKRQQEKFSEGRLPISYGAMNREEKDDEDEKTTSPMGKYGPISDETYSTSALARSSSSDKPARVNPYLNVVSRLTPSDLISRFTATASPRVQDAVRTTILGLIGGLPQMAFETKTVATGERLASLMFQLQMTGYMFKNAEYRLSLSQSLGSSSLLLEGDSKKEWRDGVAGVKGKIKVRYGAPTNASNTTTSVESNTATATVDREVSSFTPGMEVEVDAQNYMYELRGEVSRLREELESKKQEREEEIRKDLLLYIRTLPQKELKELTGTMSPEVLDAMKGLVTAVLAGIGDDKEDGTANGIGPNTVTEQSGESLAELCMWQLVVGFNLRELEVREEIKSSLKSLGNGSDRDEIGELGESGDTYGAFE